jgi:Ca2+-binding RTX toxin-like protein
MPVVNDYTALLGGFSWNGIETAGAPVIVTFSFPTAAPAYDSTVGGFTASTVSSFLSFTAAEQAQATAALGEWAAASGLIFVQVVPGQGDINFQNVDFNTTAGPSYAGAGGIAFYPFGNWNFFSYPNFTSSLDAAGDVFMNTQFRNPDGTVNYGTLLHEIGHAIGLKHPTEVVTDHAAEPSPVVHDQVLSSDDPTRTIMATVGDGSGGAAHLLTLDQQAAAYLYGPAGTGGVYTASASGSNAVSNWSWNAATQTLTQTAVAAGETIRGSSVNDVINGSSGNDRLFGLGGTNSLFGGAGNDSLYGGLDSNHLVGGTGNDTYYVNSKATTIVENANEGNDTVVSTVSFTLPQNVETLSLFGMNLTGTANNQGATLFGDPTYATRLTGGTGSDTLNGGAGNDRLDGKAGADTMYGGAGNDTYYVDNAGDQVIEAVGGGTDTVYTTVNYTLAAGQEIETLRVSGSAGLILIGNEFNNKLYGGAGGDTLNGGAGNDTLNGEAGVDVMTGGAGNDTYYVDNAGDQVIEAAGGGTDTVYATVNYTLAAGQEIETMRVSGAAGLTLTGNEFKNTLYGGAGNDTLNGGAGNDTLSGGLGNDTLNGGAGMDVFVFNTAITGGNNVDTIADFNGAEDMMSLAHTVFSGLPTGTLSAAHFAVGSATGTGPEIVYDNSSGALFYDSNGAGAGGATQFATLSGTPALAASNFKIT